MAGGTQTGVALVGLGMVSGAYAAALGDLTERLALRGIHARSPESRARFRAKHGAALPESCRDYASVDEIAAVEGIDGLFIGPADMSVSASQGAAMDPENDSVLKTMDAVAEACNRHGKYATGYAQSPKLADEYRKRGFRLISCGSDYRFICAGAAATLKQFGN